MGQDGELRTSGPLFENLVTRERIAKLKGIPIMLFAGSDSQLFSPKSVEETYSLCDSFGPELYELKIVPSYGHHDS